MRLAPTEGQIGRVTGQLVANAENGGTGVTVNLAGNATDVEQNGTEESDPFGVLVTDDGNLVAGEADISGNGDSFVPDLVNTPLAPRPSTGPECGGDMASRTVDRVIAFGDLIVDELVSPTASRTYCFDARAGDQILVNATRTSDTFFSLLVEIRDRAGTVLDSVSGATPGVLTTSVPANGPYTVRVTNPRLSEAGNYEFNLDRAN